jgi:hypothetical protein
LRAGKKEFVVCKVCSIMYNNTQQRGSKLLSIHLMSNCGRK